MVKNVQMGRPKAKLEVSEQQRKQLEAIVRRTSSTQSHVMRARIVLQCAKGLDNEDVAEQLGTTVLNGRQMATTIRCGWARGLVRRPEIGSSAIGQRRARCRGNSKDAR